MATDTVTIAQFIKANRIGLMAEWADGNPNMTDDSRSMDHWKVVLIRRIPGRTGRQMTTFFSKGRGHGGAKPTADEVLDCFASDAASIENAQGFEDWASEFGYDPDSRKAERAFKACEHQAKRLHNFLGDDLYDQLLWHTERL